MNIFDTAIEFYGTASFGRWLMPDGQFLDFQGELDHRNISHCAKNNEFHNGWLEFIAGGACSLHYDAKAKYLWIRTTRLGAAQRLAFAYLIENNDIKVKDLYVQIYDGDRQIDDLMIEDDNEMCELYLTDTIAYEMVKSEMEREQEEE